MSTTYIAIDLETTGLNAQRDEIIEVAAVTFSGNIISDQFTSLVHPDRDIPPEITSLTGITNQMVSDAPSMFTMRSRLRAIFRDHVIVGHNVDFDLGFLHEERLALGNHRIDTLTLATILVPDAGRYGLEAIANYLRLPEPEEGHHRAFSDAITTVELFLALREKALALEPALLEEIVMAGKRIGWPEMLFFEEVMAEQAKQTFVNGRSRKGGRLARLFNPPRPDGKALAPPERPKSLDPETVATMIMPGGNFSRAFPAFEYRPQQVEMLYAVVDAFNSGAHVMVEAGTGTGKSMGYLVPSAFWAYENDRRVVISTNTINLQDQLIHKDIPELAKILPFKINAAVRKGRSNYICTRLFQQMRHSGPRDADEMALFARILLWLPHTKSGDVAELNLRTPGERIAWSRLNAENSCTADHCASEFCPLHLVKRQSEMAHLLVVNHSLLLANIANEQMVLPPFVDVVIDEAHHLESAVTDGLSFRADKRFLDTILEEVGQPRGGILGDLVSRVQPNVPADFVAKLVSLIETMREQATLGRVRLDEFFEALNYFLQEFVNRRSPYADQIRLTSAVRTQPGFDEVELSWDNLSVHLGKIGDGFHKLARGLRDLVEAYDIEDGEDLLLSLQNYAKQLAETQANLDAIIMSPTEEMIYWVEFYRERISLHAAPLHVGPLVEETIFHAMETVVMTSATMRTADPSGENEPTFDYIKQRLHGYDVDEMAVGSPFDYKNSTLLYLATDIPEPNQPGYQRMLEDAVIDVARALNGRTMVLFTSYGQLSQTARAIEGPLADAGIVTLSQSSGGSRQMLLDEFKNDSSNTVLLGTRSFWEGVDVPGVALQALLIAKIPFDVPSDPIFAARSETFDSPFFQYSIPEAVLRFRQGFGRLIRRGSDEGVVAILDKRVLTKRYGQLFVDALPECTVLRQRTGRLGELTLRWLNRDK